jgi:tripartite-type tricarboxylate transporter receptor subunit TctC
MFVASSGARLVRAFFFLFFLVLSVYGKASASGAVPVRVIVPAAPGGAASLQAEFLAAAMGRSGSQPFLVDHRSTFGREAGEAVVARSPADGYTLLLASASLAVRAATLLAKHEFDPSRDLRPVIHLSSTPLLLVVHPAVPANSVEGLLALARRSGPRLEAASSSVIGLDRLASALLLPPAVAARISALRGESAALLALTGGQIDVMFVAAPPAVSHFAAGRLRVLAATAANRHPALARLPVIANSSEEDFVGSQWYGLFAPATTPDKIVAGMYARVRQTLRDESVVSFFSDRALVAGGDDPAAMDALLRKDIARYSALIRRAGLVL